MPDPTPRSFKTECLRYKLARADLLEHYAACVQALADKHGVEITAFRSNISEYFEVRNPRTLVWCRGGGAPMGELSELLRAGCDVGIKPSELFGNDRAFFTPRTEEP